MASWDHQLLTWFDLHRREMPWRSNPLPYWVWVSEIMLQQTQVATVIPYFNRFIELFPTVEALASADQQAVLKAWEGLGYYSRARNIHKAAKLILSEYNGQLPDSYEGLQQIPGIGPYVGAAIASIAFSKAVPVVDGNVLRVFSRFWGIETDISKPLARTDIFNRLSPIIKSETASEFNQSIMELGALVCTPKSPSCLECPLSTECVAYLTNRVSELPVKQKKSPVPHFEIAVAVIWKDGQVLISKRKPNQLLGGLWEFPGGKRDANECLEETATREVKEETGLDITVGEPIITVDHAYTHFKIKLTAFSCNYNNGIAVPKACEEVRWVLPEELETFPFPKANKRVIEAIMAKIKLKQLELFR